MYRSFVSTAMTRPWRTSKEPATTRSSSPTLATRTLSPPLAFASARATAAADRRSVTDAACSGYAEIAGADAHRQALRIAELDGLRLEAGPQAIDGGDDLVGPGTRADDQELVRAVARDVAAIGLVGDQGGDLQQDLVGGRVPVRVVEEPEVVDVHERDADASLRRPRALDLVGEEGDDRPVVEHPGQRVAARRLDELAVLAGEPAPVRRGRRGRGSRRGSRPR